MINHELYSKKINNLLNLAPVFAPLIFGRKHHLLLCTVHHVSLDTQVLGLIPR